MSQALQVSSVLIKGQSHGLLWGNFETFHQKLSQCSFQKKVYCVPRSCSGKLCISCSDPSLLIQTSWTSAGLIRYLAELESVVDESVLTRKVILTHAILKGLAEYQRFNWESLKNPILIRQKKALFSINLTSHQFRQKNPQPFKISL